MAPGTPWTRTTYHLHLPDVCKEVSTRSPAGTAGLLVDTAVHAYVHRLFGPRGLGPGPAETFGALPEQHRPVGRGLCLVRVPPGSLGIPSPAGAVNRRRMPRGRSGRGLTIGDLVARTGKSTATVSRHLKRLSEYGLAFSENQQDGSTRWWRYRVNPT